MKPFKTCVFFFAVLIGGLECVPEALAQAAEVPPGISERLAKGRSQGVLVLLDDGDVQAEAAQLRAQLGVSTDTAAIQAVKAARYAVKKQDVFSTLPPGEFERLKDYSHLPIVFLKLKTSNALSRLLERPEVLTIYEDEVHHPFLSESLPLINQPAVVAAGKVGTGTTVSVIDTGVDYTRAAFGPCTAPGTPAGCKVVFAQDFATNDGALDDDGHGTNVAGTVLGVASDTRIAALDVFEYIPGCGNCAYTSVIIDAINWSIANQAAYNIVAMNLSLGGGTKYISPCPSGVFATPIGNAKSAGILTAAASGNSGWTDGISAPACAPAAVSVGAVYDSNVGARSWSVCSDPITYADLVTCFSNSASFLSMLAPGCVITAAGWSMCGTSQATPHVAGTAAVLRAPGTFPSETVDQTVSRMTSTGVPVTDPKNSLTKPRLDLLAASESVNSPPYPPSNPSPANGATGVSTTPTLSWTGGDPDPGDTVTYDVYFGTAAGPPLVATNLSAASYSPGTLMAGTTYFWRIVVRDTQGATTSGPTWSFTTATEGGKTWWLRGKVTETGGGRETALAGVTMTLTGAATATTLTNNGGNYSFRVPDGTYTVTPGKSGYAFTPVSRTLTVAGGNVRGVDFVATPSP